MSANPNPEGEWQELLWIELAQLRIPRYQRPEPDERADKLYKSWDSMACQALQVSFRNKIHWIIDGQTRAQAARRYGLDKLPAIVAHGLTEEREAELFLKANRDRLRVNAIDRHRAEAIAQEARALIIDEVLASNGLMLGAVNKSKNGYHLESETELRAINAVCACEEVYKDGAGELLDRSLRIIEASFHADSARFRGNIIKGIGYFLARDTWGADDEKVTKQLSKIESAKLDEMAAHWQQVIKKKSGSSAPLYMAKAVASYVYRQNGDSWKPGKP